METNDYTTNLQLVSQEYSDEKTSLQTKTKKFLEHFSPKDIWKIKGLIVACLVSCFLYVTYLTHFSFAFPATLVLISTIELGCRLLGGKAKGMRLESGIFMVTSLLQGLQISLWGLHDNWGSAQILCLHASILLYLMARTGQSSQDRLGIMVWLDLIYTSCIFPLKYFFIGAWTLLYKTAPKQELSEEEKHVIKNHKWMILISIMIALVLTVFAASQLSQVLPAFGQLWRQFFQTLATLLDFTYALFILTATSQMGELLSLNQASIPAHQASHIAVQGFWQLVRVSTLNLGILAGFYIFSKESFFTHKGLRFLSTLLFAFASLFALIAGWKLFGVYMALYGVTPRRLLSGWFVTVLFIWCVLTLIRLYKPIQATRLAVFYATISFTLVSLLGSFIL